MVDLRELEDVTANRRLNKHQFIKRGFEFDVYSESYSSLKISYSDVLAHSVQYENFKVACIEHLLVLKLAAYQDRKGNQKGDKDARDILRLILVAKEQDKPFNPELFSPYLDDEIDILNEIINGKASIELADGNSHDAKRIRGVAKNLVKILENYNNQQTLNKKPKI